MFRALLCQSSGAHDCNVDYHIGRFVLGYSLQPGHYFSLPAPNFQPTANQERNDQCGNQHYSRELLMIGIVVPETCWAYKKYNKIITSIYLVPIFQLCGLVFNTDNFEARISADEALKISYRSIHLIGKLRAVNHDSPLPYSPPFSTELKKKSAW